jgi:transcriptional pleiotropic regulator of transition state genes
VKDTGIVRRVDDLGRIVVPAELRRLFGIHPGDPVDISVEGGAIVLRKVEVSCVLCDGVNDLFELHGRWICGPCRDELAGVGGGFTPPTTA